MTLVTWAPQVIQDVEAHALMSPGTLPTTPILWSNGWSPPWNACRITRDQDASYQILATNPSERSSTATIESSIGFGRTSLRSRRCFTVLARFASTDDGEIRASNFRLQPTAAAEPCVMRLGPGSEQK